MRTRNSMLNVITSLLLNILNIIFTFVVRTIFIKYLGTSYLGLNGLLSNILSMLSVAELGFGTAITFSLYKPLANKDDKKISQLMTFYKKTYFWIGIIILTIGTILSLFLKYIIKEYYLFSNITIIYFLYLINSTFWYFISYKETLINADQKNYKLSKYNFIFKFIVSILEIFILVVYKNYILYLIVQIFVELIKRIYINRYITREYSNIDFNCNLKIDKKELFEIKKNIKAMILHKIGEYTINSTDNIILSSAVSLSVVGIYSNYLLIINTVNIFLKTIFQSIISSIGNFIVEVKDNNRKNDIFNKINFIGFLFYGVSSLLLYFIFNKFIIWWIGKEYIFEVNIVLLIVINFYVTGMRMPLASFKSAAGLYDEDKYIPIMQAIVNLIVSIILVKYIGIAGVLLGTLVSSIVLPLWHRPYIICKYILDRSAWHYYKEYIKYFLILIVDYVILSFVFGRINITMQIFDIMVTAILTILVFMISVFVMYGKSDEFKYIIKSIKRILKKR